MGGATRLDGRLEAMEAMLTKILGMLENANLTGLQDTVAETGTFLETRLAMVESQIAYCGTQLTQQVKTPSTVTTDAAIQTKLQEAVFHAACQVDIIVTSQNELVPQMEDFEERIPTAVEAHPEWAGGEGEVDAPEVLDDSEANYPSSLPLPDDACGRENTIDSVCATTTLTAEVEEPGAVSVETHNPTAESSFIRELASVGATAEAHVFTEEQIFHLTSSLSKFPSESLDALETSWNGMGIEERKELANQFLPALARTSA